MEIGQEEGMAYLFILIIIVLLGSLGFSLSKQAIIDNKIEDNIAVSKKAIYAAEAALEYGRYIINIKGGIPDKTSKGEDYITGRRFFKKNLEENLYFELYINNSLDDYIELTGIGINKKHTEVVRIIVNKKGNRISPVN